MHFRYDFTNNSLLFAVYYGGPKLSNTQTETPTANDLEGTTIDLEGTIILEGTRLILDGTILQILIILQCHAISILCLYPISFCCYLRQNQQQKKNSPICFTKVAAVLACVQGYFAAADHPLVPDMHVQLYK